MTIRCAKIKFGTFLKSPMRKRIEVMRKTIPPIITKIMVTLKQKTVTVPSNRTLPVIAVLKGGGEMELFGSVLVHSLTFAS